MSISERTLSQLALAWMLAITLGLAACGRKGPLDLPPSAGEAAQAADNNQPAPNVRNVPRVANDPVSLERKPLPIDKILN